MFFSLMSYLPNRRKQEEPSWRKNPALPGNLKAHAFSAKAPDTVHYSCAQSLHTSSKGKPPASGESKRQLCSYNWSMHRRTCPRRNIPAGQMNTGREDDRQWQNPPSHTRPQHRQQTGNCPQGGPGTASPPPPPIPGTASRRGTWQCA